MIWFYRQLSFFFKDIFCYSQTQDIKIQLRTVSNSGRIGDRNVFTLTIPSNDNPHGVVQFTSRTYSVDEQATNSVQQISLVRT